MGNDSLPGELGKALPRRCSQIALENELEFVCRKRCQGGEWLLAGGA